MIFFTRLGLILTTLTCLIGLTSAPLYSQTLAVEDVHILTMEDEQLLENQTLIIENGIITWMGDSGDADIPQDAEIISGDFYVMPGLAEMHAHIPQPAQSEQVMQDALTLYLVNGITTIRGMLGHPEHLKLRDLAERGEIDSPRILTSGPSLNGGSVDTPEEGREMVRQQADAGYDLIKLHPGLTEDQFDAIASEANRLGIPFSGHVSHDVGLIQSLNAGQGTIDHLDRYMEFLAGDPENREDPPIIFFGYDLAYDVDISRIQEAARLTKEAGVWNVPTHTLLHNVFNPDLSVEMMREWPGMDYVDPSTLDNWSEYVQNVRSGTAYDAEKAGRFLDIRDDILLALHREEAGLMLGADAPQIFNPPGFAAHRELELIVNAGISPFDALRQGTANVAQYLGEEGESGIIKEGARADLILLATNPLRSIPFQNSIEGVISSGVYYDRSNLDQMLEEVKNRVENQ